MFLFVFAGAKRGSGEVVKFESFIVCYLPIEGLLHSALHSASKMSQKVLVTVVLCLGT